MQTLKTIIAAAVVATSFSAIAPAQASDEFCGYWAFAGAYQNYNNARRQANRFGGDVLDLDRSNSPNAGQGFHVVAKGPYNSRSRANRRAREYRRDGVRGAYAAHRCFYVSYNN